MVTVSDTLHPIVKGLLAAQAKLRLKDAAFAAYIGIPRGTWAPTKLGRKALGVRVARAAMRFPELQGEALAFLVSGDTDREDIDTDTEGAA